MLTKNKSEKIIFFLDRQMLAVMLVFSLLLWFEPQSLNSSLVDLLMLFLKTTYYFHHGSSIPVILMFVLNQIKN
jgi:hypothetical protein